MKYFTISRCPFSVALVKRDKRFFLDFFFNFEKNHVILVLILSIDFYNYQCIGRCPKLSIGSLSLFLFV